MLNFYPKETKGCWLRRAGSQGIGAIRNDTIKSTVIQKKNTAFFIRVVTLDREETALKGIFERMSRSWNCLNFGKEKRASEGVVLAYLKVKK